MKFSTCFYFILILALVTCSGLKNGEGKKQWCWTKSMANEPNFVLDSNKGGLNWGYCQKNDNPPNVNYVAIVTTSQIEKSDTDSQVKIQMWGEKGKTKERILSSSGFERGSEKKVEFSDIDIGKIQKIALKVVGNQGYRCKNLTFKINNQSVNFECLKRIEPCKTEGSDTKKCTLEIEPEGDTPFEVTIKTSDDVDAGTKSPLLIQLKGTKGESLDKMYSELGLQKGSTTTTVINVKDIGEVTGFKLTLAGPGKWKPVMVNVKNLVSGLVKNFDMANVALISPGSESFSVNQNDQNESTQGNEPGKEAGKDGESGSSGNGGESSSSEEKDNLNIHNPYGGLIEMIEKKDIIKLTCDQKLLNPSPDQVIFGPEYPTRNINYIKVLAQCPSDCHKVPGTVFGIGIHPDQSPICLSAIVDKAMSLYGGIISISIYPGIDAYTVPPQFPSNLDMISVKSLNSKSIMKSYVISKVDNIDLVDKDIRVVDNKGNLTNEGRLELRIDGKWGTVCSQGNSPLTAKLICRNIGYRSGEWKAPVDGNLKDFCRNFKGFDYCGANASKIHFEKIECAESDKHFNTCNKQLANLKICSHGYDSIISCYNDNYENDPPVSVGVVRLTAYNKENESLIGRLEMYNEQHFSPICDLSFNNESAVIACKQMGFTSGEFVNDSRAKNYKLDNSSNEKFSASEIQCKGTEKELKECNAKLSDIQCKHDQDVVVMCAGSNGDPSGKSQYMPKPISLPPELGKLGINKIKVKCDVKGNNIVFRGDPGSIYLIECPANCSKEPGIVSGTGLYTGDSNICLSAIHSGVIDDPVGGVFALIKSFGQMQYPKSTRFGVLSNELNQKWQSSFSLSQANSGWLNMFKIFEEGMSTFEDTKQKKSSFLQISEKDQTSTEAETSIPKPLFKYVEPSPNYVFNEKSNFLIESHNLSRLSTYTILTRFKMEKFNNHKEYIFSYSGCDGFNLVIDKEDNLVIGSICNPKDKLETKIMIPLNEVITLYIGYEKGSLDLILMSEKLGKIKRKLKTTLEISPGKSIGIGRLGQIEKGFFQGEITYALVYDSLVDEKMISLISNKIRASEKEAEKVSLTEDGRKCVSPCLDTKPGEGNPPNEAKLDAFDESSPPMKDDKGNVIESKKPAGPGDVSPPPMSGAPQPKIDLGTYDKSQENNIETIQLECSTNLIDNRFTGQPGKVFRVHCPICTSNQAVVYGTGIYHPMSSICKAAMHMGVLEPGKQADLLVELTGEKDIFTGSEGKDKSVSGNFAKADRSFKVTSAEPLKNVKCETTAGEDVFQSAPTGAKFVVVCPKDCSKSKLGEVFGSEIYSDNSSICISAIHFGVINDNGGEIEFIIDGEQSSFKSTHGFGITSKSKDSYIRSFRFLGQKSAMSLYFKEDYQGKLQDKWKIEQDKTAEDKDKDYWMFKFEDRKTIDGHIEKFHTIIHTGTIRSKNKNNFASWILLKNSEFANGVLKFNLKFVDLNPVGVIFRYSNTENYYAVLFDPLNKNQNVSLLAKITSTIQVIESKMLTTLINEKWFRCTLILNVDQMTFMIQQENVREHKIIFHREIKDLNRGSIGFATNGNHNFYLNGVSVEDYKPNMDKKALGESKKTRSFEELVKKTTKKDIKHFCGSIFEKKTPAYIRCTEPHDFCQVKCDSTVPRLQEPIINYRCFRDCVRSVYNSNSGEANNFINHEKWSPIENTKIDFLVHGETIYRPAVVVEVINRIKKKILKVDYTSDDGEPKSAEIEFPSTNIVKCCEKLPQRRDCAEK